MSLSSSSSSSSSAAFDAHDAGRALVARGEHDCVDAGDVGEVGELAESEYEEGGEMKLGSPKRRNLLPAHGLEGRSCSGVAKRLSSTSGCMFTRRDEDTIVLKELRPGPRLSCTKSRNCIFQPVASSKDS